MILKHAGFDYAKELQMLSIYTMADLILFNIVIVYPLFWVLDRVSFHIVMLIFFNVCALLHECVTFWNNTFSEMSMTRMGQPVTYFLSHMCGREQERGGSPHSLTLFCLEFSIFSTSHFRRISSYIKIDYPRKGSETDKKAIASFVAESLISFPHSFALATPLYLGCLGWRVCQFL